MFVPLGHIFSGRDIGVNITNLRQSLHSCIGVSEVGRDGKLLGSEFKSLSELESNMFC